MTMRLKNHETHKWRFSLSDEYDAICDNCGVIEDTRKAGEPCLADDLGRKISEETQRRLKAIDDNIKRAMQEAHRFFVD
jgi:hypothetical protein